MTEGSSVGLLVVLAIVIFGILITTAYLLVPKTDEGTTVFREGSEQILNGQEKINPRSVVK